MEPVLSYIDYRQFIKAFYEEKKKSSKLTYREFAKLAGFSSPVFIKLVIEGKANLRKSSIVKLCNAMELKKKDRSYFKNLVLFCQAKDVETKMQYLDILKGIQSTLSINKLCEEQFKYFSKWYHPVIKELLDIIEFDGDYDKLGQLVNPQITGREAKQSVKLLLDLKLIEKIKDGQYKATHKFISTSGLSIGTLAIRNVQKKLASLAGSAVDSTPKKDRDISGVSISISSKSMEKIKDELAKCRKRILEITSEDSMSDSVYRVNLHLFPISKTVPKSLLRIKKVK